MLEEKLVDATNETLSRRNFLVKAGVVTAGMAVAGSALGALGSMSAEAGCSYPIPYKKLDPKVVRKRAFDGYFAGGCCYGAAKALLDTLVEVNAHADWAKIPADMFRYGKGGAWEWGTICGALNGALFVVNMAMGDAHGKVTDELMAWYCKFPFPTTRLDAYSSYKNQVTTISNSPLCHNSVSIWCAASGKKANSIEKKNRCGKLTGDVAAMTAELLNKALVHGTLPATAYSTIAADAKFCMPCHSGTGSRNDEQGKMACNDCHDDEHDHTNFAEDCGTCHK